MNRLEQIEARLAEIARDVEQRGAELSAEQLTAFENEVTALQEERRGLLAANEQRSALLESIAQGRAGGQVLRTFPSPTAQAQQAAHTESEQRGDADPLDSMEYRRAFRAYVTRRTPIPEEFRADAVSKTTENSAVIPTTILNRIIEKMENVGMILPRVTRTAHPGGVSIPTSSVKPVATWVGESEGSEKQKKTTGSLTFAYHKLRCAVAVSLEMDTMALSAFETTLTNNIVEAMTKTLEQAIISGNGEKKPKGILAETPEDGQALTSDGPCYDDLINAEAALPEEYENGAVWCMSKKTFMAYQGLLDEVGQPIARTNYGIAGRPERSLLGRPVVLCNYVPTFSASMGAGQVYAFIFNFEDYILNTNYSMTMKTYDDNDSDDKVTKAIMLTDGKVAVKGSLVTIKKSGG